MTSTETVGYHKLIETASEFKWTLYNFSTFNHSTGKCISSQIFLSNDIKWRIYLYPNGDSKDSAGNVSIFLNCLDNTQITIDCEVTMSNSIKVYCTMKFKYTYKFDRFSRQSCSGYGYSTFINRDVLLADLKNGNDILTIIFKINFSNPTQETNSQLNLIKDVGSLFNRKQNSDVILISSDQRRYKAHKAILVCRSKVFSAMFQHNMKESRDNIVKIEDVDGETLKGILHFMYSGELVQILKDAKKLLIAADKYELNDLKTMCSTYMCKNIKIDNALDMIEFAVTYNISELEQKAKKYFLQNRKEILSIERCENLKNLSRDIVEDLFRDLAHAV